MEGDQGQQREMRGDRQSYRSIASKGRTRRLEAGEHIKPSVLAPYQIDAGILQN